MPTLAQFVRHAELYGDDCVLDTAISYLAASEFIQLTEILGGSSLSPRMRERIVSAMLDEGYPQAKIATTLGINTRSVERIVSRLKNGLDTAQETNLPDISAPDKTAEGGR